MTEQEKYLDYLKMLRRPFKKLCRLRFLQPDGSTAFMLDNSEKSLRSGAFIAGGSITHTWRNGRRTNAAVTLDNVSGDFDYNFNNVWFGQEIALDEGLVLSDGKTEFYIQQGVFLIEEPDERTEPVQRTVTYNLVDKAAALDGSLGGNLECTYQVEYGTNVFEPIAALLAEDRGNGLPVDGVTPVFTEYYNGRTQELPDGTTANMTDAPYTLTVEAGQTKLDVIAGLAAMLNAWVGYDETGALRIDPSQDDVLDTEKPVQWQFSTSEAELLGMAYKVKNSEIYNDYIVTGEQLSNNRQPSGRAYIRDSRSPVAVGVIGRKTKRESKPGYGTDRQCQDYAEWMLKRVSVLHRAVTISCSQIMHVRGNELVTIKRTDKPGAPEERHLVQGFTRPLAYNGAMTITATSVQDIDAIKVSPFREPDGAEQALKLAGDAPFTLRANTKHKTWDGTLEYATFAEGWTEWDGTGAIESDLGAVIWLRGTGNTVISYDPDNIFMENNTFYFTGEGKGVRASGSIEYLLDYQTTANGGHPVMDEYCFADIFGSAWGANEGRIFLTEAPAFPSPAVTPYCYSGALAGNELKNAPGLPAVTLAEGCYSGMLAGNKRLFSMPALPALTLAESCYEYMADGCTALAVPAKIEAQVFPASCCRGMYRNTSVAVSQTQSGEYIYPWRLPYSGAGSAQANSFEWMIEDSAGTFTGDPAVNTTYYTSEEPV